jgi:putative phosphoesterase
MKIGLISDTHGQRARTAQAIRLLQAADVQAVLHAGDVGDAEILAQLGAAFGLQGLPVHAVAGNVDGWDDAITRFPASEGVRMHVTSADLELGGQRVFMTHGHHHQLLEQAIAAGRHNYVIHGHTHVRRDEQVGPTRVINPGAVQRSPEPGVAVLDLADGRLTFLDLPGGG